VTSIATGVTRRLLLAAGVAVTVTLGVLPSCSRAPEAQTFASAREAAQALRAATDDQAGDRMRAIFGPEAGELLDTADPVAARRNRQVFAAAFDEHWELVDDGPATTLVVGHESWPFPVPLVKDGARWRFDTAAGLEEVIARRIGRNELSAIQVSRAYVVAQRLYARRDHDGVPAGTYAMKLRSDAGRQNGLYWPAGRGENRSPIGELLAKASSDRVSASDAPGPFHGYLFRILTGQGPSADGGARSYVEGGRMSGGFALVAWPATYDVTGVMTFIVNHDGRVYQRDLGPSTGAVASAMKTFDPDANWSAVE
jgi:hypothetical protein